MTEIENLCLMRELSLLTLRLKCCSIYSKLEQSFHISIYVYSLDSSVIRCHICFLCLDKQLHSHLLWCVTHVYSAFFITLNITADFVFYFYSCISSCLFSLSVDLYFCLSFVVYCLWSVSDYLQWCDLIVQTRSSSHSWNLEQCVTLCVLKRWFSLIHKDIHFVFKAHNASYII